VASEEKDNAEDAEARRKKSFTTEGTEVRALRARREEGARTGQDAGIEEGFLATLGMTNVWLYVAIETRKIR
jgi:hypothetical protein